jgi:GMP synthase-like glutamine amidotransferase
LLAASTRYPYQAFRLGPAAWGLQFHIECDTEMMAVWAQDGIDTLIELDIDPIDLLSSVDAAQADVETVWKPFAARFAALAKGELETAPAGLPMLGTP